MKKFAFGLIVGSATATVGCIFIEKIAICVADKVFAIAEAIELRTCGSVMQDEI